MFLAILALLSIAVQSQYQWTQYYRPPRDYPEDDPMPKFGKDFYTPNPYRFPRYNPEFQALKAHLKKDYIPYDGKQDADGHGAKDAPLERMMEAKYKDGVSEPVDDLPNPRKISNKVGGLEGKIIKNKLNITALFTFWGQFMDHDIGLTTEQEEEHAEHMDIEIPKGDKIFDPKKTGKEKIEFRRSIFIDDKSKPRKFPNVISTFIDATNVYGDAEEKAKSLRSYKDGKMLVSEGDFLPFDPENKDFFIAGDIRANENLALTAMHTLFLREHNRRCEEIKALDKKNELNDEEMYQLARSYVIALLQKITIEDWLPLAMGPKLYYQYIGDYKGYDSKINPSMLIEFSTSAFRFGHSLLVSEHPQIDEWGKVRENLELKDMFLQPKKMTGDRLEWMFRGLTRTHAK